MQASRNNDTVIFMNGFIYESEGYCEKKTLSNGQG